jgi:hypothetical protein
MGTAAEMRLGLRDTDEKHENGSTGSKRVATPSINFD